MTENLCPNISMHILLTSLSTFSRGADKENLFNNQELSKFMIISFILITYTFDSRVIL